MFFFDNIKNQLNDSVKYVVNYCKDFDYKEIVNQINTNYSVVVNNFKEDIYYLKNSITEAICNMYETKYWKEYLLLGAVIPVSAFGVYNVLSYFAPIKKCLDTVIVLGSSFGSAYYIYDLSTRKLDNVNNKEKSKKSN